MSDMIALLRSMAGSTYDDDATALHLTYLGARNIVAEFDQVAAVVRQPAAPSWSATDEAEWEIRKALQDRVTAAEADAARLRDFLADSEAELVGARQEADHERAEFRRALDEQGIDAARLDALAYGYQVERDRLAAQMAQVRALAEGWALMGGPGAGWDNEAGAVYTSCARGLLAIVGDSTPDTTEARP